MSILITIWLLCAIETAGTAVAYLGGKYDCLREEFRENLGFGLLVGLMTGPIGAFSTMFLSGFWKYGWRLWPIKQPN